MKNINWDEAPEGTTHYDTSATSSPWIKIDLDGRNWFWFADGWICTTRTESTFIKDQMQNQYTLKR